jgi:TBC1 domain family member 16
MRSLRLFSTGGDGNDETSCGQLVVASRESQYKILHFHHGGLQRLGQVLAEWSCILRPQPSSENTSKPYQHFMVCRCVAA